VTGITVLPKLYTDAEAAHYLGCDPETVARERRRGRLGFIRIGRVVKIREDQLARYVQVTACASTCETTSPTAPAPTTSAGPTNLDAHAADLLARAIAPKLRRRARNSSSNSTAPATSDPTS
jgi:excisionase family DNA binding protein